MNTEPTPTAIHDLDWRLVPSPAYVVDTRLLERNARILQELRRASGAHILLALKGFAMWSAFPHLAPFLDGCAASGAIEARLGREELIPHADPAGRREVHTYSPAFSEEELAETLELSDTVIFNSPSQLRRHLAAVRKHNQAAAKQVEVGLRVNPEFAEVEVDLYNPCAPGSRLGSTRAVIGEALPEGVDGLHFHVMCEQGAQVFVRALAAFEERFGDWLPQVRWVNCGGGHWITKPDYDVELLVQTLRDFQARYPHLRVYLEPGEAAAVDTGVLVSTVLDIHESGMPLALLDVSATCHMPDVLEMPYRPTIHDAALPDVHPWSYRLGGPTCLAGDVIGDWSFPEPLQPGDRVIFADMAHYTMVKTTMFNGVRHPSLVLWDGKELKVVRQFDYRDFRDRLS